MKTAIFIYATPVDTARGYRALGTAQDFVDAGDEVAIVHDGTGLDYSWGLWTGGQECPK